MQKKNVQKENERPTLMDHLVVYGFPVITIGIVIGTIFALYSLGLLNLSCSMQPGFFCNNVALTMNGNLTLSISETTSPVISNAIFYLAPQNTGFNPVGFPTTAYKCYPSDVNLVSGQT